MILTKCKDMEDAAEEMRVHAELAGGILDEESGFYAIRNGAKIHWMTLEGHGEDWWVDLGLEGEVAP